MKFVRISKIYLTTHWPCFLVNMLRMRARSSLELSIIVRYQIQSTDQLSQGLYYTFETVHEFNFHFRRIHEVKIAITIVGLFLLNGKGSGYQVSSQKIYSEKIHSRETDPTRSNWYKIVTQRECQKEIQKLKRFISFFGTFFLATK